MRRYCCLLPLLIVLNLGGCAWLAAMYEKPKGGGKSTMQYIADVAHDLPYGGIIEAIIGLGGVAVGGSTMHHVHTRKKKPATPPVPPAAVA